MRIPVFITTQSFPMDHKHSVIKGVHCASGVFIGIYILDKHTMQFVIINSKLSFFIK